MANESATIPVTCIEGYDTMDEETGAFLTAAAGSGVPLARQDIADIRNDYEQRLRTCIEQAPAMAAVEEHAVPVFRGSIPLRIYRPVAGSCLPVILFLHGGGFVKGSIDSHEAMCRELALRSGLAVAAAGYRLAPEHRYPVAQDDCICALHWLGAHAAEAGVNGGRMVVAGDSAGGQLAAALAVYARDAGLEALRGQILFYPCVDMASSGASHNQCATGFGLTEESVRWYYNAYLPQGMACDDPAVSPLYTENLQGVAPAAVFNAVYDPVRSDGELFVQRLRAAGVSARLALYPTLHGFVSTYTRFHAGRRALAAAGAFAAEVTAG